MWWISLLSIAALVAGATSPPLKISLETSWPAPPLILEILETVFDEEPSSYFPLLNLLTTHFSPGDHLSPRQILTSSLDFISTYNLLPRPSSLSTFNLALGLHTSGPRIEAEYGWYESSVDEAKLEVEGCGTWVEWRGKGFCVVEDLKRDIELSIEEGTIHDHARGHGFATVLPFDHVYPTSLSTTSPHAILYLDPSSPSTAPLLNYLNQHADQYPSFQFVVRYRPTRPVGESEWPIRHTGMSGYGVEMALKKTDYLVVDDRSTSPESPSGQESSDHGSSVGLFSEILGSDPWTELSTPLNPDEIKDLALKAAMLIMSSSNKLEALRELSQDFPKYSAALARKVTVSESLQKKVASMFMRGASSQAIYINGKTFDDSALDAYSLLKLIRDERRHILALTNLGLTPIQAFELISDRFMGQAQVEDGPGEGFVDASDRPEGGKVITWWNDLEKDARYKQWPRHAQSYLRPLYPGQLHTVRRNTWNLVFVLDLSLAPSLETIATAISLMIQRGLPIRFGIVPMTAMDQIDISSQMAKIFHYSVKTFGRALTRDLMTQIFEATPGTAATPGIVKLATVRRAYEAIAETSTKTSLPFDEVLSPSSFDEKHEIIQAYTRRLMATKDKSSTGHLFINGKHVEMGGQWPAYVQQELTTQTTFLQEQLASGVEYDDYSTIFYDLPSATIRRSKYVLPGLTENKLRVFNLAEVFGVDATKKLSSEFLYNPDESRGAPITIWIIGDLDSAESRAIIEDGLIHLQRTECASRLGFVHIPSTDTSYSSDIRFSAVLYGLLAESALHTLHPADFLRLIREFDTIRSNLDTDGKILVEEDAQKVFRGTPLHAFSSAGWSVADTAAAEEFWKVGHPIAKNLGIRSSQPHLLINGRLIGPITPDTLFVEDFDVLEVYELRKRVKLVIDLLKTMYDDISAFDRPTLADLISTTSSIVASAYKSSDSDGIFTPPPVSRTRMYEGLDNGDLSFTIGNPDTAILHVAAVVDPVSEQAQKWSSLLTTLTTMENTVVSVYLRPAPLISELKLKRFYRYTLSPELAFDVDGNEVTPEVTFSDLPTTPIFTLGMDTPPAWIVSPKTSPYDLDNLVLGSISEPVHVLFNLKQLLIEGHARESNNAPPRGLQLQLTAKGLEVASDTQVMANLGYLQFKATPGVYNLVIRPGRGTEVYELESVGNEGWDSKSIIATGTAVALTSFEGVTILPRFERRPGMEMANVLMEDGLGMQRPSVVGSMFSKIKSMVGFSPSEEPSARQADINIFTVASGLLYERFASIMILSVMKNTNSSVKFWFIENFLSPTFLDFIPKMAEEYGFEYEFVTYKWPRWLYAQTEKQRIIWAYKILFLDVLFPMDLDKVIFVDADQIVRTDMKELVNVDLQGHVYGYPPMGDSRTEMEGFRFWKTGYWLQVLRGRPYHISALYVVDLKRFRQLATGDRLRGQYHGLAADPNSLANLDQDLPNSMQDQIPIFTLDQDWLWCQTWCSDESLAMAKTIDLCQNPLTKEPKLVRARQIAEWDVYDQEIAAFAARISGEEGGAIAASVDDLAGGPQKGEVAVDVQGDIEKMVDQVDEKESTRIDDEL